MSDRQLIAAMETVLADQTGKIQAVRDLCHDRSGGHNLVPIGMVLTALGIPIDDYGNPLEGA